MIFARESWPRFKHPSLIGAGIMTTLFIFGGCQKTDPVARFNAQRASTAAAEPTPKPYTPNSDLERALVPFNCVFSAYVSHPKDKKSTPLVLCFKEHTEVRGIYEASACVAVNIEPESAYESPFYGSKGHWGAEGRCSRSALEKLLGESARETLNATVNPISALQYKRLEGYTVEVLRDDYDIGPLVLARSEPLQNPRLKDVTPKP